MASRSSVELAASRTSGIKRMPPPACTKIRATSAGYWSVRNSTSFTIAKEMSEHKTALVLSAGGMFGAYQAGAYRAIAELAPPDIVVGASVGALNGWPIAGGCTPDHLIERWLDPSAGSALKLFPNHGWRNGWFDPAPLRARAEEIRGSYEPRMPFGLVVVQLPRLSAHLVKHPDVTAAHLQATCSIPLFLPSVEIDGRRYLDGGLF